jgi:ATP-binding cassette, subfamily F, member 3
VAAAPAVAAATARPSARLAAAPSAANNSRDERKTKGQARSKLADQTRPLRNELAAIDQRLAKLGAERTQAEALLTRSTVAPAAFADAGRQLAHIAAEVTMLEERWLELQQQLESIVPAR